MENTENNKTISIAADDIANAWDDILQGIKARERTLYVLMTSNSGIDIMSEGEFIIFSVKNDWQAIRLNESRAKRLIENVIQKHLGLTSTPSIKIVSGNIEEKSIEKIVALANLSEQEWRHDNEEQLRQDLEQLRAIVHTKRRAQKILEQRHAKLGDITPVGIIIEMEDTVEEIKKHEAKIKEIK